MVIVVFGMNSFANYRKMTQPINCSINVHKVLFGKMLEKINSKGFSKPT